MNATTAPNQGAELTVATSLAKVEPHAAFCDHDRAFRSFAEEEHGERLVTGSAWVGE
jgi:hypothetical protein